MPLQWVDNAVFLKHQEVTIYYLNHDDLEDQPFMSYHFGLCPDSGEDYANFDVRDLPDYEGDISDAGIQEVIIAAIDSGVLTQDGIEDEGIVTRA